MMKAKDLRERTPEDLRELEKSLTRDVFQARFKNFTNRLDDTSPIRKTKQRPRPREDHPHRARCTAAAAAKLASPWRRRRHEAKAAAAEGRGEAPRCRARGREGRQLPQASEAKQP